MINIKVFTRKYYGLDQETSKKMYCGIVENTTNVSQHNLYTNWIYVEYRRLSYMETAFMQIATYNKKE